MPTPPLLATLLLAAMTTSFAEPEVRKIAFSLDDQPYESALVIPESDQPLPGIFMVPNWMGVTDAAIAKATRVAEMGYVVYVADVYTKAVRPTSPEEAGQVAGALRADRPEMQKRALAAYENFRTAAADLGVTKFAAIGFCFGGGTILEMARAGADASAFVSFHGDLTSPTLDTDSDKITGNVLVLHGADDPFVPPADVQAFEAAMRKTKVTWQLNSYGGAVHSFTDPTANSPGKAMYNPEVSARAFAAMNLLLQEVFATPEPQ